MLEERPDLQRKSGLIKYEAKIRGFEETLVRMEREVHTFTQAVTLNEEVSMLKASIGKGT